jgi:hypothetical protein
MNRREFIAGARERGVSGPRCAGLLLPINGLLVADYMAYRADADEGYDYDDVEHDP